MSVNDIGIDLGTKSIIIYICGKGITLNEPSVVAINDRTEKIIGIGEEAFKMIGKTPSYIHALYPIKNGVISNYNLTQEMVKYFVKKSSEKVNLKPKVSICIPSSITEVEAMAVVEAAKIAGARKVFLIDEPVAAAIGSGININKASGNLIVDIGGGSTDIAVISLNGIVKSKSIKISSSSIDKEIVKTVKDIYGVYIGEITAEKIKKNIVNVYKITEEQYLTINGKSTYTRLPVNIKVKSSDFLEATKKVCIKIISNIKEIISDIGPELVGDIYENGILLTGGGSLIKGISELIEENIKTKCKVSDNAVTCVAEGSGKSLDLIEKLETGFREIK